MPLSPLPIPRHSAIGALPPSHWTHSPFPPSHSPHVCILSPSVLHDRRTESTIGEQLPIHDWRTKRRSSRKLQRGERSHDRHRCRLQKIIVHQGWFQNWKIVILLKIPEIEIFKNSKNQIFVYQFPVIQKFEFLYFQKSQFPVTKNSNFYITANLNFW